MMCLFTNDAVMLMSGAKCPGRSRSSGNGNH